MCEQGSSYMILKDMCVGSQILAVEWAASHAQIESPASPQLSSWSATSNGTLTVDLTGLRPNLSTIVKRVVTVHMHVTKFHSNSTRAKSSESVEFAHAEQAIAAFKVRTPDHHIMFFLGALFVPCAVRESSLGLG